MALSKIDTAAIAADAVTDAKIDASLGKALQMEHSLFSNLNQTTTSTTFQNSSLTDSITPSSTNNKVLGFFSTTCVTDAYQNQGVVGELRVMRGTTEVTRRTISSWTDVMKGTATITFVDSPSTTSATTYTLQYRRVSTYGGSGAFGIQHSSSTQDSEVVLLEIGG